MTNQKSRYLFGAWKSAARPLTVEEAAEICGEADRKREALSRYPLDKVLELLGRLGKTWQDPKFGPRKRMLEVLPAETGFSREMVELGLDELPRMFDPDVLEAKLESEMRGIPRLGEWKYQAADRTSLAWQPLGTIFHVLAGNVFLVGAGSLLGGLVTGNVSIFKMSSGERVFLPALIRSLQDIDRDGVVSGSLALVDVPSSNSDVLGEFKRHVDGIVVWGGEEAVKGFRNDLPARTRLIIYGPKLSIAVVTRNGLAEYGVAEVARRLAGEIAIWDQNACTAPQVCFVQDRVNAEKLAAALPPELEKVTSSMPPGPPDMQTAVEIRKLRTVFEVAHARGEGRLFESPRGLDWTVVLDHDREIQPSPLHRTLRLVPFDTIDDFLPQMRGLRGYLQTVGLISGSEKRQALSRSFIEAGAVRVTDIGAMSGGVPDDPHDGAYDLPQFVNIVFRRSGKEDDEFHPFDFALEDERKAVFDSRLRKLVRKARSAPYFNRILGGLEIQGIEDLPKIPILTREELERHILPGSRDLVTGPYWGGYVSRSGGSTGEPKFSVYDGPDWEQMIAQAVRLFRAAGIRKGDRLANCFLAGDLYGSFVSFDHINVRVGVTTFGFAGDVKPEIFHRVWKGFGINVVQGVPTVLLPLFRTLKKMDPEFGIEKILFAGSPMSPSDREWIVSELGTRRIASVIGANDGGEIGFQCAEMTGTMHHSIDDFNYIEIVDEAGKPLVDGEAGRVLITSLLKYAVPLIRYDIGDLGRIVPGKCPCGRTMRRFEFLGRSGDTITVGLLNITLRDFREALKAFPISEIQLAGRNEAGREFVVIRLETEERSDGFKKRVLEALYKGVANLRSRIESGKLWKVVIELFPPGALPRNPRTGKVKGVLDERE